MGFSTADYDWVSLLGGRADGATCFVRKDWDCFTAPEVEIELGDAISPDADISPVFPKFVLHEYRRATNTRIFVKGASK